MINLLEYKRGILQVEILKIYFIFYNLNFNTFLGQDRFLAITTSYYRGSDGVFLVYDVTNEVISKFN